MDWCWSWNSNTLATWCEELTHLKRSWCWERLRAGREGDDRGWDGCIASPTQWTWVWVDSGSWWWTGRPSMLRFTGSQRVRHDWATELNWTEKESLCEWSFIVYKKLLSPWSHLANLMRWVEPTCLLPFQSTKIRFWELIMVSNKLSGRNGL